MPKFQSRPAWFFWAVMASLAAAATAAAYGLLSRQLVAWATPALAVAVLDRARLIHDEIEDARATAARLAARPEVVAAAKGRTKPMVLAETVLRAAREAGFVAARVEDRGGATVLAWGGPVASEWRLPLAAPPGMALEWAGAPRLAIAMPIEDRGVSWGTLVLWRAAPRLASLLADGPGASGETVVCGALSSTTMRCLPSRFFREVGAVLPRQVKGEPLPMHHALNGQAGVVATRDYRLEPVLAAYAPIEQTGLGVVFKLDRAAYLWPVWGQAAVVIVALVFAAGFAVQRGVLRRLLRATILARRRVEGAKRRLAQGLAGWEAVLASVEEAVLTVDAAGQVRAANPPAQRLFRAERSQLLGETIDQFLPKLCEGGSTGMARAMEAGREREMWARALDGRDFPVQVRLSEVTGEGPARFVVTVRDLSERQAVEARMLHLASHDTLTGLPNRNLLADRMQQAIAAAARNGDHVGVLFVDLDHFKTVNDSLGHQVGDRLLQLAAARIKNCLREEDTVARQGGDEFLVVLPRAARFEDVGLVASKILHALGEPFAIDGHELHASASIGISVFPEDGEDVASLLRNADVAMYYAKSRGRGNYQFFAPEMNRAAAERLKLENALRHALERGEFGLHFQPIVGVADGRPRAAEALLRWHPADGPVSPDRFIPVAEETGLIVPIGEWVLRQACEQYRMLSGAGVPLARVVVNLSARQFAQRNLVGVVGRILRETGVAPEALGLEITESLLVSNPAEASRVLRVFADMGIQISVDDFGTGYSSLSYLKRFPIHKIKVDRSFVRDVVHDRDDAAIVTAIISMAHSLKCGVVAEGVETEAQLKFLASRGCEEYQGYHFSRPLPSADLRARLAACG